MNEFKGFKRGVNLGGWLSQSSYEKTHLDTFITENDIELIRSWGGDHVRLPFDFNIMLDENGELKPDAFFHTDRAVEWCEKRGMNIVLDLHKTMGYSFDKGENETGFFENERYQDIFLNLWSNIARHYRSHADTVAFELLNEITDRKYAEPWNRTAARAVKEIRKYAPDNYIVIGGIYNNSIYGLTLLDKPADSRIVYSFHYYDPLVFTHQKAYWIDKMPSDFEITYPGSAEQYYESSSRIIDPETAMSFKNYGKKLVDINFMEWELRSAAEISKRLDVPLYCGEYGVIDAAPEADTVRWHEDIHSLLELYDIGRAMWNFRGKDYGITDEKRKGVAKFLTELI